MTDAHILSAFPRDYAAARDGFRRAAAEAGCAVTSYETGDVGPRGEALTIDVAVSHAHAGVGTETAIVLSSGLHGVEAPFGSAVQVTALREITAGRLRPEARLVLVHALNPSGFAWSRRVDARNVDLNRAFRWPGMPDAPPDGPYGAIDALLNPPRPPSSDLFRLRVVAAALRAGPATLKRAIAAGQRSYPRGLFYAGTETPPLQTFLEREVPGWLAGATTAVHLDFHTGLGRRDNAALIVDYPLIETERAWWTGRVGAHVLSESLRDDKAYTAIGSLGQWCAARRFAPRYRFAFAEFGTFGGPRILAGLRAENRAHHWAKPGDAATIAAKAGLRTLFCPPDADWRVRAVRRALALIGAVSSSAAPA